MQLRTKSRRSPRFSMAAIVSLIASWSLSLVTTASLVAVGWLGHSTHWTFGLAGHAEPHGAAGEHAGDAEHAGSGAEGASVDGP